MRKITRSSEVGRFTQGSIFKYLKCISGDRLLGVVITARCDIALRKSRSVLCLPVYELSDWMDKFGKAEIFRQSEKQVSTQLGDILRRYTLSPRSLSVYGLGQVQRVLTAKGISEKDQEKVLSLSDFLLHRDGGSSIKCVAEARKKLFDELVGNRKADVHFFERVYPNEPAKGYVVDLSEPVCIRLDALEDIAKGLEYQTYQRERDGKYFGLDVDEGCAGEFVATINPPYVEHLLQRFSHLYSRIGTENISNNDLEGLRAAYEV